MPKLGKDDNGETLQLLSVSNATVQVLDGSVAAHTTSAPIDVNAKAYIRVATHGDVYIAFGISPVATDADIFIPAGMVEWFSVPAGQKVSIFGGKANISIGK